MPLRARTPHPAALVDALAVGGAVTLLGIALAQVTRRAGGLGRRWGLGRR